MKLLIVGHGRHGKDTMAEILNDWFEFEFMSSSMAAAKIFLFEVLKEKYGYKTFEECYEDRSNHRAEWFKLITEYNADDRMRLAKEIVKESDCYVGMRNADELKASEDIFDLIVWVDASERLPLEDKSSMDVTKDMADIIIDNNGTLEEFTRKVVRFGANLFSVRKTKIEEIVLNFSDFNDVQDFLEKNQIRYRIVSVDGIPKIVTADFRPERINLRINNNKVTSVSWA